MSAETPASSAQLLAWAADPGARTGFSALTGTPCLLLDARALGLTPAEQDEVAAWLRSLPCPTLGLGAESGGNPVALACDVLVPDAQAAASLLAGIHKSPLAAAVFVQLLRHTEGLALEPALMAESLAYSTLQAGPEYRQWLAQKNNPPLPLREGAGGRGARAERASSGVSAESPLPLTPSRKGRGDSLIDEGPAVAVAREEDTLQLELNRPGNRNAMSVEMRDALMEALQLALADPSLRTIRLSGRGKCFSTGGDLEEFGSAPDPASAHLVRGLALPGRLLAQCAERTQVRVHGACIGSGIEFPAFASHIEAARDAWFQLPELSFGLIPGAGGCVSIPRRIGRQRAAWLVLSGKRIDAETALAWGLVDALTAD